MKAASPAVKNATTSDGTRVAKRGNKRPAARPYKKLEHAVLQSRISTMQRQLHVMSCKTELLKHRLTNYEKENQQRDEESA